VDDAGLGWLSERILGALARGESVGPQPLAFLVHQYAMTGRDDLGNAAGAALGSAIDLMDAGHASLPDRRATAEWVALLADAALLSDDDRLRPAAASLTAQLRHAWPNRGTVSVAMSSIDACLRAAEVLDPSDLIPAAIDELERIVGLVYRPGAGVTHSVETGGRGDLADHTDTSVTLVTAYLATGRLPYAMLADDLMQFARRCWWDDGRGLFVETADQRDTRSRAPDARSLESEPRSLASFVSNCEAARVLCRLAALHGDERFRQSAAVNNQRDPAADAERILAALAPALSDHGVAGAVYGLAVAELNALV
jgi:uncharacterized protein YyaL (SSP411 family)